MPTENNIIHGSVIRGTRRPQDLIPAFLSVVAEIAPEHYEGMMSASFGPINVESLLDILNDHVPDGWYFGAHPDDLSNFGFWPGLDLFEE